MQPLVIEVAVNGGTTKARNPNVPREPNEVAADAIACIDAGAHIIHTHLDDFSLGGKDAADIYLKSYRAILKERPNAVLYPTMGKGDGADRVAHVDHLAEAGVLRMTYLDPGSVNFGSTGPDGGVGAFKWLYQNSFADIEHNLSQCAKYKLVPSMAIYEPSFLRAAILYHRAGKMPHGFVKFYFSGQRKYTDDGEFLLFGLPPTEKALDAYLEMLEGTDLTWATAVIAGDANASGMTRLAIERGGHVRVGLEDYAGSRTPTNLELLNEVIDIAKQCGRPLATTDQAARILGLHRS
jgi:3-keto-5-aminohexanoate cleavage enzyme